MLEIIKTILNQSKKKATSRPKKAETKNKSGEIEEKSNLSKTNLKK